MAEVTRVPNTDPEPEVTFRTEPTALWAYLCKRRMRRQEHPSLRVHPSTESLRYSVAVSVPRKRKDGSPGEHRQWIYSDMEITPHGAILDAALRVQAYMHDQFGWDY